MLIFKTHILKTNLSVSLDQKNVSRDDFIPLRGVGAAFYISNYYFSAIVDANSIATLQRASD